MVADLMRCLLLTQSRHWPRQSRVTAFTEYRTGGPGSVHLDGRELDHLGPLLDLYSNEFGEFGGRHWLGVNT
jgi:hypothetical protein